MFHALKSDKEIKHSQTETQIINDLVKNFTRQLKELDFGELGMDTSHVLKVIEEHEVQLVKRPIAAKLEEVGEKDVIHEVFSELRKAAKFSERCAHFLRFLQQHDTDVNKKLAESDLRAGRVDESVTSSSTSYSAVPVDLHVTDSWKRLLDRLLEWATNVTMAAKIVVESEVLVRPKSSPKDSKKEPKKRKAENSDLDKTGKKQKTKNPKDTKLDCQVCGGQHHTDKTGKIKTCWAVRDNHPQRNKEGVLWKDSHASRIWMDNGAQTQMAYGKMANGDSFVPNKNKGKRYRNVSSIIASYSNKNANLTFSIPFKNREEEWIREVGVVARSNNGLLDTGAEIACMSKRFF